MIEKKSKLFGFSTLTGKFTAFLFVMSLAPILVLGWVSYQTTASTLVDQELRNSSSMIAAQEKILNVVLREIEGLIHNISGIDVLIDAMNKERDDLSTYEHLTAQARIGYILNGYLGLDGLVSIDVISENGSYFHVGQTLAQSGVNKPLLEELQASSIGTGNRIVWAGVTRPINLSINDEYVLTAAKVIRKADSETNINRLIGTIIISYELASINEILTVTSFDGLGSSMLLDQSSKLIYQQDGQYLGQSATEAYGMNRAEMLRTNTLIYQGQRYFVSHKDLTLYGWTLLRIIPENIILARTRAIRYTTMATVAFALAILMIGFLYLTSRIVNPIGNLVQKFQKINRGDFDLSDRMVEIGNDEITDLTRWFNLTVATLSEREAYAQALKDSETRHALILNASHEGIWDWNLVTDEILLSTDFANLIGLAPEDHGKILALEWVELIHPDDRQGFQRSVSDYLAGNSEKLIFEYRIHTNLNGYRWILSHGSAIKDDTDRYVLMAGSHTDTTNRKEAEQQLTHDAFHDKLTGLYNRAFLFSYLTQIFASDKRENSSGFALLFLDLDGFKSVNDSLGHAAGDRLLQETADRLKSCLRDADVLTRFGGDEFIILLNNIEQVRYAQVAQRIIASLNESYLIMGHELKAGVSIGVTLSSNGYSSPEEMMRDADLAMYRAKSNGKNCFVLFDSTMKEEALHTIRLEYDIQHALDRKQMQLHYQSIVDAQTNELQEIECFVRWNHPEKGILDTVDFIEYAEQKELLKDIGYWVVDSALEQFSFWKNGFLGDDVRLKISINLSLKLFYDEELLSYFLHKLEDYSLPASALVINVKASMIANSSMRAKYLLQGLKSKGCDIHLDDFSMGYSSLGYLIDYPVDGLKIDRALINIDESLEQRQKVIQGIVQFANTVGVRCIAEGVETQAQLDMLRSVGCHSIQGLMVDKPATADDYYQDTLREYDTRLTV
ncbi:EAL domain-containing protein [Reinekea sp.]|jgi:diguanylate cyclase (GGDEF)-like protein/PAS domain S-box-containing protein|uniref:bifunctional diguanylate cyclase/phosphodiesterase n=1 Tax=Reinekea sp. TaxID=1970455 RepID=UPI002A7F2C1C|nr:EAL domain-containing protein [Reinekea sp.]